MTDYDSLDRELENFGEPEKEIGRSTREERIVTGFEEIQRFVDVHGRTPRYGDGLDIFERIYAARLDSLKRQPQCLDVLVPIDRQGLLVDAPVGSFSFEQISDNELLGELEDIPDGESVSDLKHVRPRAEINAAEEIAGRERCENFSDFKPLFELAQAELKDGRRQSRRFQKDASVEVGNFFILGGQMAYVSAVGESIRAPNGANDARLRVIYGNGTESNILRRSLQRALYKDEAGRRLTDPELGPLFRDTLEDGDKEEGTIYVLRSKSQHPFITEHRQIIHKIGVTGGKVEQRIADAVNEATYLLAEVEIVAKYTLAGINRSRMENLIHKVFASAQLDLTIRDRFGKPVRPREWFLVPLEAIEKAIEHIRDGTITSVRYDKNKADFVPL